MVERDNNNIEPTLKAMGNGSSVTFLEEHDSTGTDLQCFSDISGKTGNYGTILARQVVRRPDETHIPIAL
jgi:hypothetical protein